MAKKESKKSESQEDAKLRSFVNFLKEEKFKIQKDNPNHRPGEGYGPPRFIEWDIDHVVECFINRFEQKLEDKTEEIF